MVFSVEFDRILIFQGVERILEGDIDGLSVMRIGKNGVKWTFCRTHYRTQNGGRGVGTSDMPFLTSGCYSQNVNHPPIHNKNIL